jgi:tetratricopeptide (TPR) repeat protein
MILGEQGMSRKFWVGVAVFAAALTAMAQERRPQRIEVKHYTIEADVNPRTQALTAKVQVDFVPLQTAAAAVFELNSALNVSKVEDGSGRAIGFDRSRENFSVTLRFPEPLAKGAPAKAVFYYAGRLTDEEDSPVFGIQFAALHEDSSFLLYPARWFPVSGYTTNRYTADLRITVPAGYKVLASGVARPSQSPGGKLVYSIHDGDKPAFPGSIAIVQGEPARISSEGVTTNLYFRGDRKTMAGAYGQEIAKAMVYFTSVYGLPPVKDLTVVETGDGAANGYSAPSMIFLSPQGIGKQVNQRLVANQVSRQWWGTLVSPATRADMWIVNGLAHYSELLYLEHGNGSSAYENEAHDVYVDALTMNDVPISQTARLEDYSPEFWSLTASKGAAVIDMLRYVTGQAAFDKILKDFPDKYAWSAVRTDDFEKVAETDSGQNLRYFFLQWIESSGAPEFKLEYTIYRTAKGFRVMGKVAQDLDTFRMPVELKIETEGNPERKTIDVTGTSTEFLVDTFGKPKTLALDPNDHVLRFSDPTRVAVAIRKGEQFAQVSEFNKALEEYQKALEVSRNSSLAHYRIGEIYFLQNNYQSAANEFRESLNGDLEPKWTEVWAHINLGKIFDATGQRERAVSEYTLALRTKDNTQSAQEEAAKYLKAPYERKKAAS